MCASVIHSTVTQSPLMFVLPFHKAAINTTEVPCWICLVCGIHRCVTQKVLTASVPNRIPSDEPTQLCVEESGPVVVAAARINGSFDRTLSTHRFYPLRLSRSTSTAECFCGGRRPASSKGSLHRTNLQLVPNVIAAWELHALPLLLSPLSPKLVWGRACHGRICVLSNARTLIASPLG